MSAMRLDDRMRTTIAAGNLILPDDGRYEAARRERAADRDRNAVKLGQPLDPRGQVDRVADQRIGQALR